MDAQITAGPLTGVGTSGTSTWTITASGQYQGWFPSVQSTPAENHWYWSFASGTAVFKGCQSCFGDMIEGNSGYTNPPNSVVGDISENYFAPGTQIWPYIQSTAGPVYHSMNHGVYPITTGFNLFDGTTVPAP
jgi:hypothetical protein